MSLVIGEYHMPQPEVVRQPAYSAIHQALADRLAEVEQDRQLAEAKDLLDSVQEWAETLLYKLTAVHKK